MQFACQHPLLILFFPGFKVFDRGCKGKKKQLAWTLNFKFFFFFRNGSHNVRIFQRHNHGILHNPDCVVRRSVRRDLLSHVDHEAPLVEVSLVSSTPTRDQDLSFVRCPRLFVIELKSVFKLGNEFSFKYNYVALRFDVSGPYFRGGIITRCPCVNYALNLHPRYFWFNIKIRYD